MCAILCFLITKELNIYGDNIVECFKIITRIRKVFKLDELSLDVSTKFLTPKVTGKSANYRFIFNIYANFDKWENNPITFISKKYQSKLQEYPDVIVFEKKEKEEILLFAVEFSNALSAGNQAWQRQGRCFSFSNSKINFFYVVELGGSELDSNRKEKSIRYPNPVVILSYLNFMEKFKKPFYPIFELSSNSTDNFRNEYKEIVSKNDFENCLNDILTTNEISNKNIISITNKTKEYFLKLFNRAGNINNYTDINNLINNNINTFDYFTKNKFDWKKSISIKTTTTLKKLKNISEKYGFSIISKNLPFVLIPEKNRIKFINELKNIYKLNETNLSKLKNKKKIVLCFILGFKPRGDDARPDRGLNPLLKMIFNDEASIISIIYGPATMSLWKTLNSSIEQVKKNNGLFNSIFQISDVLLVDSKNYPNTFERIFFKKEEKLNKGKDKIKFNSSINAVKVNEHDVDNALFLFFRFISKIPFFESMINPPGGDWSNIDLIDNRKNIYRWTNLPRVSGKNTKRPDHIYTFNITNDKKISLIVESKYRPNDLEENIGVKLTNYVMELTRYYPNCIQKIGEKDFKNNRKIMFSEKNRLISAVAYYSNIQTDNSTISKMMQKYKIQNVFEIFYEKNFKTNIIFFSKNIEILNIFKKLKCNNNQINFSVIKI